MNTQTNLDRRAAAWLADGPTELSDRVLGAALREVHLTHQRRVLRLPWRFPLMPALSRTATIAVVVLVAAVGAGGLIYLNSTGPGGFGGRPTPSPTQISTTAPTAGPTATEGSTPSPAPSQVAPGITAWTSYTSEVYGITFGYPDGWTLDSAATRKWQAGDDPQSATPYSDVFMNPETRDGDQIGLGLLQKPAGPGADITSHEGLTAWAQANMCDEEIDACETVPDVAIPMCLGRVACLPAVLVPLSDSTTAFIADPENGLVTIISIFRPDSLPAAARYGGSVELLKSILTTMDVWTPEPGQIPSGS